MGWFLRSKSSRTGRKSAKPPKPRQPWDPQRTLAALKALGVLALLAGLGVGWHHGRERLNAYVAQHAAAPPPRAQVHFEHLPGWMNPVLRQELSDLVAMQLSPDPLNRLDLLRAHSALAANPWVKQVHRLERRGDGSVRVQADFRRPVAVVLSRHDWRLVDIEGVQLPGLYLAHQAPKLGLPMIVGPRAAAPGEGRVWPGEDLAAGIALGQWLIHEPYLNQIRAIDVSQRDSAGRCRLLLRTDRGLVRWGLAPGQEQAIEPDVPAKLRRLRFVSAQRGSIDAGGQIVDIYGARVLIHPRLEEDQPLSAGYTIGR